MGCAESKATDVIGMSKDKLGQQSDKVGQLSKIGDVRHLVSEKLDQHRIVLVVQCDDPTSKQLRDIILDYEGVDFEELDVASTKVNTEMIMKVLEEKTGAVTVPMVLIEGKSIGGYEDVKQLHESGHLRDALLPGGDTTQRKDSAYED